MRRGKKLQDARFPSSVALSRPRPGTILCSAAWRAAIGETGARTLKWSVSSLLPIPCPLLVALPFTVDQSFPKAQLAACLVALLPNFTPSLPSLAQFTFFRVSPLLRD